MGEARRRLEKDPNYGKGFNKKEKTSNTKGLFHVTDIEGEHLLVVYLPLVGKEFGLHDGVSCSKVFWENQLEIMSNYLIPI